MKIRQVMKCWVAIMLMCMSIAPVWAQKNIDKLVEELEKSDEASINSVTKRDPKTRKITRMVKNFSLTDVKIAQRLIAAFEKDEEYAVSAIKDMPKGRKSALKVNFTFIFQQDNEKRYYMLTTNENGKINLSVNIQKGNSNGGDVTLYWDNDMTQWTNELDMWTKNLDDLKKDLDKRMKKLNKKTDKLGCTVSSKATFDDKKNQVILEGDVWIDGKKMKKGTYTMNGRKVIVQ